MRNQKVTVLEERAELIGRLYVRDDAVIMKNMQAMQDGSTPKRGGARGA
jgi:hypothetical protein